MSDPLDPDAHRSNSEDECACATCASIADLVAKKQAQNSSKPVKPHGVRTHKGMGTTRLVDNPLGRKMLLRVAHEQQPDQTFTEALREFDRASAIALRQRTPTPAASTTGRTRARGAGRPPGRRVVGARAASSGRGDPDLADSPEPAGVQKNICWRTKAAFA